jgi:hypothetical protein
VNDAPQKAATEESKGGMPDVQTAQGERRKKAYGIGAAENWRRPDAENRGKQRRTR